MVKLSKDNNLETLANNRYAYFGTLDSGVTALLVSDDTKNWTLAYNYTDLKLKNVSTTKINDTYYIASDNAFYKTNDFDTFIKLDTSIADDKHSNVTNFEWFRDENDSVFIKYNASTDSGTFTYFADFDETTDSFVNAFNEFLLPAGQATGLTQSRGNYYIWMAGDKLYKATNFRDKFEQVATDIKGSADHKAFFSFTDDNYTYVYTKIDGKTYVRSSMITNMIHFSDLVPVTSEFSFTYGSFIFNPKVATETKPVKEVANDFDKIVRVKANGIDKVVPLSCIMFNTFQLQWEKNSTYQISFTAYDDNSLSYTMLSEEATVTFDGQQYVIKQITPDSSAGVNTKQVTATHIYNEINRVRQRNTKTGTITYSVEDVLKFYLAGNKEGFTYHVYSNFPKQQIADLGNSSGADMISKITSTWTDAVIYPDNKVIRVYSTKDFETSLGKRIDYLNNSSQANMTIDSTTITNEVKAYGKQIENTSDNATDNAPVKYYFEPFIVRNEDSIGKYGVRSADDISDERFTDKKAMEDYAKSQLQPEPAVSISISYEGTDKPVAGEVRHLTAKPLDLETDLSVIGFTWYPFDTTQKTSLTFANLPASLLRTQSNINLKLRGIQLLAQQAINSARTNTTNYVSPTDPVQNETNDVRSGDIWTQPLINLTRAIDTQDDTSDTNETIYTDPNDLEKSEVQVSIWNGMKWLEISNQRTTNVLNENTHKVADEVKEAQKGIATAVQQAQKAVDDADKAIKEAGFATDTATTAKEVADSVKGDVTQAKEDSATALSNAKDALDKAQQAITDIANGKTDLTNLQTKVNGINTSLGKVSGDLDTAKGDLDKVAQQAKANGESIVSVTKDVSGLKTDVADTQGNVSQVVQQAQELSTAITNAKGDISKLQQTATALTSSIKDNAGDITSLKQTATKLSSDMKDAQGNISSIQQTATDLSSTVGNLQAGLSDTNKKVSSQGTQITQNKKDIISKANQTDVDTVTKRVTTAETSIKQNAKDITSKASQSDVNTLTGRVKTAESNITQNANSIKSKVSSSDVQGMLDKGGYATQKWTGSEIDQKANEISSTVTEVSNKVDGLSYDNRNLIIANDLVNGWIHDLGDVSGGSVNPFTTGIIDTGSNQDITITKAGKVVIIGEYDTDKKFITKNRIENPDMYYQFKTGKETEYIRVTFGFSKKDYGTPYKIEKGNKATDWTPAPEDMATVTALSKVDQKADSISTTVTNNKKDTDSKFTNINQTISGIQSTVKNKADSSTVTQLDKLVQSKVDSKDYNSKITQLANDINLRVQSKDLLSQINVQAGSTLIQSNKLYLDSSSVVFSGKAFIPSAAISSISADKITAGNIDTSAISMKNEKDGTLMNLSNGRLSIAHSGQATALGNGLLAFSIPNKSGVTEEVGGLYVSTYNRNADINGLSVMVEPASLGHNLAGDYFSISKATDINGGATSAMLYSANTRNSIGREGFHYNANLEMHDGSSIMFTKDGTPAHGNQDTGYIQSNAGNTLMIRAYRGDIGLNPGTGKRVFLGKFSFDGGNSLYATKTSGAQIYMRGNGNNSRAGATASNFTKYSKAEYKKDIKPADYSKLAKDIYNMDIATFNYKDDASNIAKSIGGVIGDNYHINDCFLSEDKDGISIDNVVFALVATVQKQAKQISELLADVEALKIKNGD